jgi:putative transposase
VHCGADRRAPEGRKKLIGLTEGARESAQDWRDLLLDLKRRELDVGFWTLPAKSGRQRANRAAALLRWRRTSSRRPEQPATEGPNSQQPKAEEPTQARAAGNLDGRDLTPLSARESYVNCEKVTDVSTKIANVVRTSYQFPADQWTHLPTTNPIESPFASGRHHTVRSKGGLSNRTALGMVFKLIEARQKSRRRRDAHNQSPKLILGVNFAGALAVVAQPDRHQPTTIAA